jgi:hypothetical protein
MRVQTPSCSTASTRFEVRVKPFARAGTMMVAGAPQRAAVHARLIIICPLAARTSFNQPREYHKAGAAVKNLRIFATLVNGEQLELRDCPTGYDLVRAILREATASAKALVIEATDKDGRVVRIVVPADDSEIARVSIARDS